MFGFRSFTRRAAAALLAIGITLGGASSASADSSLGYITLPPGAKACLPPVYASYFLRADGVSTPSFAHFTVGYSRTGGSYQNMYGTYADFFAAEFRLGENLPGYGYFRLCARNPSTTDSVSVDMSLGGY